MGRPLRYVPPDSVVEITLRTVHGRFLLRPSPQVNDLVVGVIGRAQRTYDMRIHGLTVLSNHLHLLLSPESPQQLASFMAFVAGNIARELGRLHGWREKFWSRRYRSIPVSHEAEAQLSRLSYILGQGVKEGLVERPQEWPGVHCVHALTSGKPLEGRWIDRTLIYQTRRRGKQFGAATFAHTERIVLTPLPCSAELDPAAYRKLICKLVSRIVTEGRDHRGGKPVLGKRAILAIGPLDRPPTFDRSPAPLVHAATTEIFIMLRESYRAFVAAFREAAQKLRRGHLDAVFPKGSFPPPIPLPVPNPSR